eukprot:760390-Hanusia_phi.AAC.1
MPMRRRCIIRLDRSRSGIRDCHGSEGATGWRRECSDQQQTGIHDKTITLIPSSPISLKERDRSTNWLRNPQIFPTHTPPPPPPPPPPHPPPNTLSKNACPLFANVIP